MAWRTALSLHGFHLATVTTEPDAMSPHQFDDFLQNKNVRFALAIACGFLCGQGIHLLMYAGNGADAMRGGGELLLWGSLALANLARLHDNGIPGIRLAIYVGAGLIVASWLM